MQSTFDRQLDKGVWYHTLFFCACFLALNTNCWQRAGMLLKN